MPSPNWFDENKNRAFPFKKGMVGVNTPSTGTVAMRQLPDEWIVDAGFTVGTEVEFLEDQHHIYLTRIYRSSEDQVFFQFESDCPDLAVPIIFSRTLSLPEEYITDFVDSDVGEGECDVPLWSGYLVTGDLSSVADRLAVGEQIIRDDDAILEPALIRVLSYLISVNLANSDRTRVESPAGCPDITWPHDTGLTFINARCMQGELYWKPGYNCDIIQNDEEGSLTIMAVESSVEGAPCEEVPLFDGESPPDGATNNLYSGGPLCNETLRSINGIGGPMLSFLAGAGVSIVPDPDNNRVTVDVNMLGLAVCFDSISYVSESV